MRRYLGAVRDKEDIRDFRVSEYLDFAGVMPEQYDVSGDMGPVRDQGNEGTCVAFASATVKEEDEVLSPRFIYDRIELFGGGAYPRDAMKVLKDVGVCPETCQPYQPNMKNSACKNSLLLAKPNKIRGYARLYSLDEMKLCLVQNGPFMISMGITDKWFDPEYNAVIKEGGETVGGHAVVFVGYSDARRVVKIRNSWGKSWGMDGYAYIKYEMFMNQLWDAWSCVDIPEAEEEKEPPKGFWAWLWSLLFSK